MLTRALRYLFTIKQALWARVYARQLGVSRNQINVSGPCLIHGGGHFEVGRHIIVRSTAHQPAELYCAPGATLALRDGCFLNQGVHIACCTQVIIGEGSLLADEVLIMDSDFHATGNAPVQSAPVILEKGVWIGARAIILKGVTVGEGAVVGAGAVVVKSIPPRSLAVGNPASIVRNW